MIATSAPRDRQNSAFAADPAVAIKWPAGEKILLKKDAELPPLAQADNNFEWTGR